MDFDRTLEKKSFPDKVQQAYFALSTCTGTPPDLAELIRGIADSDEHKLVELLNTINLRI